jgi:hypothetical protein
MTLTKRQEATILSDKRRQNLMSESDNWRQVRCRFLSLRFGLLLPPTISLGDGVSKKSFLRVSFFHAIYLCHERIVFRFRDVVVVPFLWRGLCSSIFCIGSLA